MITKVSDNNSNLAFTRKEIDARKLFAVKQFTNNSLSQLEFRLLNKVQDQNPNIVKTLHGVDYIPEDKVGARMVDCVKDLAGIPLDFLSWASKKIKPLQNSKIIQKHNANTELDNEVKALQGLYHNGLDNLADKKFVSTPIDLKNASFIPGITKNEYEQLGAENSEYLRKLLNSAMASDKSTYDTKKERLLTRIVSGFTAATFLGADFYNKPISKGKSVEEAEKAQHKKQAQEIKENLIEGFVTFGASAVFARQINSKVWVSALVGALVSLAARIISRISTGMPLTRIKVPDNVNQKHSEFYSMDNYIQSLKDKNTKFEKVKTVKQENDKNQEKKNNPVLSLKNILKFCAASIIAGFALRYLHGKYNTTNIPKIAEFRDKLAAKSSSMHDDEIVRIMVSPAKMSDFSENLKNAGERELAEYVSKIKPENADSQLVDLGEAYATKKLFNKFEVNIKDLRSLRTAPFAFIKELAMYPYKVAFKIAESFNLVKNTNVEKKLEDPYFIKNIFQRYQQYCNKYGENTPEMQEHFQKYVKKLRLASLDDVKSSKIDNSKIAVMAQTMGTLMGMGFNMNDEFNSSIKNGSTKEEAEKDARLRGINKFFRMSVQVIISGSLNNIFRRQYNGSLFGAGMIVGLSTILTDTASRFLSGMPTTKMTKEELDAYQEKRKNGILKGYYKLIDKLAS